MITILNGCISSCAKSDKCDRKNLYELAQSFFSNRYKSNALLFKYHNHSNPENKRSKRGETYKLINHLLFRNFLRMFFFALFPLLCASCLPKRSNTFSYAEYIKRNISKDSLKMFIWIGYS